MHHYTYTYTVSSDVVTRFNLPPSFRSTRSDLNTLIFTLSALRVTDHSLLLGFLPSLCPSFLLVPLLALIKFLHKIWEKQIFREREGGRGRRIEGVREGWRKRSQCKKILSGIQAHWLRSDDDLGISRGKIHNRSLTKVEIIQIISFFISQMED